MSSPKGIMGSYAGKARSADGRERSKSAALTEM
jgi:hypothetical protein